MKKKIITLIVALCSVVIVLSGFALVQAQSFPEVLSIYVIEAGDALPLARTFLREPVTAGVRAVYWPIGNKLQDVAIRVPGEYPIQIAVTNAADNTKIFDSVIKVVDTIPPQATAVDCVVLSGGAISPEAFVTDIIDETAVTIHFAGEPDFVTPGRRVIHILLRDLGGNERAVGAVLTVKGLTSVSLEAGSSPDALNLQAFVNVSDEIPGLYSETDLKAIDFSRAGTYSIWLRLGNSISEAKLDIVDTTPPAATPVEVEAWIGDDFDPMDFVTDVLDDSEVTAAFSNEPGFVPNFEKTGRQNVKIILTDASGNSAEFVTVLTLRRDTEPPEITGDIHKKVFVGDSVAYRAGVTVTDNRDMNVQLSVDSSTVNVYVPGRYAVIYSATDRAGNSTAVTGSVTVYTVEAERVYELADEVLAQIISEDMTLEQKAREIFDWVRRNVGYVNVGESDGVMFGAYRALTKRAGDCYTFFAISQMLLERAGVPSIPVERVGGYSRHYWQLIDVGTGWHHYDATPWFENPQNTFMMTESRAQQLARQYQNRTYYHYDETLYPEVVQ